MAYMCCGERQEKLHCVHKIYFRSETHYLGQCFAFLSAVLNRFFIRSVRNYSQDDVASESSFDEKDACCDRGLEPAIDRVLGLSSLSPNRSGRRRLAIAVVASFLALCLIGPFAFVAYRNSANNVRLETLTYARGLIADWYYHQNNEDIQAPPNTWFVNTRDEYVEARGEVWVDPPLMALGESTIDSRDYYAREFEFDGNWLAVGRWIGEDQAIVSVVGLGDEAAEIRTLQIQWLAIVAGMIALAGLASWLITSRPIGSIERAHDVNRDFIADAAHELRTPLSIIQASAGHALSRERSDVEYRRSLSEILTATERAGSSVGELLEFARLEAGQATPRLAPLRLDLLVEEVAASVRVDDVLIEAHPGEAVVVDADYNLIRQMIDNLTRNAAARASKVVLSTSLEKTQAKIEITDNGPGFDPGIIDHVFERFRRGDRSGNVGLGMAIARTIAELHGGRCEAANRLDLGTEASAADLDNSGETTGAVVTVWLPYKK